MDLVKRKTTYHIYPSAKQSHQMVEMLRLHHRLYNAALEQRIDAYKRCAVSLNFYDQCKDLAQLRASSAILIKSCIPKSECKKADEV